MDINNKKIKSLTLRSMKFLYTGSDKLTSVVRLLSAFNLLFYNFF